MAIPEALQKEIQRKWRYTYCGDPDCCGTPPDAEAFEEGVTAGHELVEEHAALPDIDAFDALASERADMEGYSFTAQFWAPESVTEYTYGLYTVIEHYYGEESAEAFDKKMESRRLA